MSKTQDFLKEAFAGESQANRKYQAFAAKADKEGYFQTAKLFRAASEAEAVRHTVDSRKPRGGYLWRGSRV
jgi:rubrerythrin